MSSVTSEKQQSAWTNGLYGLINAIIILPVTISFTSIIFQDEIFLPYLPILVKLVLFSSVIHQLVFSLLSSLPFCVGQVQDAGLIFLSSMATSIVKAETLSGNMSLIIPTTLVTLSLATFLLGVVVVAIGKFKLASLLQYMPMPVIGGYLAYIGFFCGQAGIAMMGHVTLGDISDWWKLWSPEVLLLISPGVAIGGSMYYIASRYENPILLPIMMIFSLLSFYLILWIYGTSLDSARLHGWVMPLSDEVPIESIWRLFDTQLIDWKQIPRLFFQWLGLCLVVSFSSTLDVAAIEMELGVPLDYDSELTMIGVSNIMSGVTGGYSGSYIFSQTIFNLRRGVNSRLCGFIIALAEIIILVIPYSITGYTPIYFYGSLLVFIAVDLIFEWLVYSYRKMPWREVVICWSTFLSIQFLGLELGMLVGIFFSLAEFSYSYSRKYNTQLMNSLETSSRLNDSHPTVPSSSNPITPIKPASMSYQSLTSKQFEKKYNSNQSPSLSITQWKYLEYLEERYHGGVMIVSLRGYIFFGSAVDTLKLIKDHLHVHGLHSRFESQVLHDSSSLCNLSTFSNQSWNLCCNCWKYPRKERSQYQLIPTNPDMKLDSSSFVSIEINEQRSKTSKGITNLSEASYTYQTISDAYTKEDIERGPKTIDGIPATMQNISRDNGYLNQNMISNSTPIDSSTEFDLNEVDRPDFSYGVYDAIVTSTAINTETIPIVRTNRSVSQPTPMSASLTSGPKDGHEDPNNDSNLDIIYEDNPLNSDMKDSNELPSTDMLYLSSDYNDSDDNTTKYSNKPFISNKSKDYSSIQASSEDKPKQKSYSTYNSFTMSKDPKKLNIFVSPTYAGPTTVKNADTIPHKAARVQSPMKTPKQLDKKQQSYRMMDNPMMTKKPTTPASSSKISPRLVEAGKVAMLRQGFESKSKSVSQISPMVLKSTSSRKSSEQSGLKRSMTSSSSQAYDTFHSSENLISSFNSDSDDMSEMIKKSRNQNNSIQNTLDKSGISSDDHLSHDLMRVGSDGLDCESIPSISQTNGTDNGSNDPESGLEPNHQEKKILAFDFKYVLGVDATAAKNCFLIIVEAMRKSNIHVVFLDISNDIEHLFRKQKIITDKESVYNSFR